MDHTVETTQATIEPVGGAKVARRLSQRVRRTLLTASIPILMLGASTSIVSASSWEATYNAGDFSAYLGTVDNPNPAKSTVQGCTIEVGVVVDTLADYRKVAGSRVNCLTKQSFLTVTVEMQWRDAAGVWHAHPLDRNVKTHYNTYGSSDFILKSIGLCGFDVMYWWRAATKVETANFTVWKTGGLSRGDGGC